MMAEMGSGLHAERGSIATTTAAPGLTKPLSPRSRVCPPPNLDFIRLTTRKRALCAKLARVCQLSVPIRLNLQSPRTPKKLRRRADFRLRSGAFHALSPRRSSPTNKGHNFQATFQLLFGTPREAPKGSEDVSKV